MTVFLTQSRNGGCTLTDGVRMRLVRRRFTRKLSFQDMGRALGIQAIHFERLERGMATPKFALLEAWANELGFNVEVKLKQAKEN